MLPDPVKKYLDKYSSTKWILEADSTLNINTAIVIPAICEYTQIRRLLKSLSENYREYFDSTLIIFVINNLFTSNNEIKKDNKKSLELLRSIHENKSNNYKTNDELIHNIKSSGLRIAFVDASTEGKELPEKNGGVGLARKIGMDLALTVFNYSVQDKKIIISLDADCTVDKNYISEIRNQFNKRNLSSAVINFRHDIESDSETQRAIICYEIFLRYYVLGLRFAGSSYAFHTIGSCMACDYESYIKVEGMNKRKAAEEFYFLEKLAKHVPINKIISTTVYPSSRISWRVPFGTGQKVKRFISMAHDEYILYNPKCFIVLKDWIKLFNSNEDVYSRNYLEEAKKISSSLYQFLRIQNFANDWKKIVMNSRSLEQISKQKLKWFDGFRTLKLIHYLRDTSFPSINMFDALDEMLKLNEVQSIPQRKQGAIPSIEIQKEYLSILRKLDLHVVIANPAVAG